jgi:hypothetical protein
MCPQLPRLSPEYSHKAGLQTVITGMPLQIRPVTHGGHAGPVTMGRIARGPLSWTRPHCGMPFVAGLRLVRNKRRVSLPVLFLLAQLLQRRLRAKGGAFAFAPTKLSPPEPGAETFPQLLSVSLAIPTPSPATSPHRRPPCSGDLPCLCLLFTPLGEQPLSPSVFLPLCSVVQRLPSPPFCAQLQFLSNPMNPSA